MGRIDALWLRRRIATFVLRNLTVGAFQPLYQRMYDIALHGMGVGAASLDHAHSGELHALYWMSKRVARSEAVIGIDVGANVGQYAETWLQVFAASSCSLHCFEPSSSSYERLQQRHGHDERITCVNAALGATSGEGTLYSDCETSTIASTLPDAFPLSGFSASTRQSVRLLTLDEYAREHRLEHIHILKLDVEGAELEVLRGASGLLSRQAVDFVQFEFGQRTIAARAYLADFYDALPGYAFYRVLPKAIVPLNAYRPKLEIFWNESNYLAVSPAVRL